MGRQLVVESRLLLMADWSVSGGLWVRPLRASLTEWGSEQSKDDTQEIRMPIGSRWYKKSGFKYWLSDKWDINEWFSVELGWWVKNMTRYLLRNGSLISIEVEPGLLDVLIYRDFSGEFVYATLSEQAEFALLKSWQVSWWLCTQIAILIRFGKTNTQELIFAFMIIQLIWYCGSFSSKKRKVCWHW